jgi:glycosyltransferase involved in cell wall biosynthesis
MKVAYITTYDAHDRSRWSGLGYYVAKALSDQCHTIEFVGPLTRSRPWTVWAKKLMYDGIRKQRYLADRELRVVKGYAQQAAKQLSRLDVDVVFSPGTLPVAYLESEHPIVLWTDSAFAGMVNFYPEFTNLCAETLRNGNAIEAAALERAQMVVYSSDWAAQTAIDGYGVPPHKLQVVPFGANIDCSPSFDVVRHMAAKRSTRLCTLLFLSAYWHRKGGDVAVEVARQLNASGLPTQLVIVGSRPRMPRPLPPWVQYYGRIRQSSPSRLEELTALMASAHFLLLPTRADCTPVVFGEANAFGVPCLATRLGGISSIIRDGINGTTFSRGAVTEYCDFIRTWFCNPGQYQELALSSFHEYETRLNWSVAGRAVSELLYNLVA